MADPILGSILLSTKQALGIPAETKDFDVDVIMAINSALFQLMQLGVGPVTGFRIEDDKARWVELLGSNSDMEAAKSYVFAAVRLVFDRPETSYGIQALERMRDEWGWRLEVQRRERQHEQGTV